MTAPRQKLRERVGIRARVKINQTTEAHRMRRNSFQIPRGIVDGIDRKWHEDIFRFVDSGDASSQFLDYLDHNEACQNVVEIAFTLVSQDVAETARQLKESRAMEMAGPGQPATVTYARLWTHLLLATNALEKEHRDEVLHRIGVSLPAGHVHMLEEVFNGISAAAAAEPLFVC